MFNYYTKIIYGTIIIFCISCSPVIKNEYKDSETTANSKKYGKLFGDNKYMNFNFKDEEKDK